MTTFTSSVTTALNEYKNILRKTLTPSEATEKIKQLKLKRRQIQGADDFNLYHRALKVIEDLEKQIAPRTDYPSWHFGIAEFCEHIKSIIEQYRIENGSVIHSTRKASCAIVEAIQIAELPLDKIDVTKLESSIKIVAQYGTDEQHKLLKRVLQQKIESNNAALFDSMLQRFKNYLAKSTSNWVMA